MNDAFAHENLKNHDAARQVAEKLVGNRAKDALEIDISDSIIRLKVDKNKAQLRLENETETGVEIVIETIQPAA